MSGPVVLVLRLLLTFSLYIFMGWAFLTLWQDIKHQGIILSSRRVPPISLTIQFKERANHTRYFTQPEVTIGRDPGCDCPVDDDAISARHSRLSFHHNQWWLEDMRSTNGTLLNNERLSQPTVVMAGDKFTCGGTSIIISLVNDPYRNPENKKS
jgi:pSer/pThr/pTyr-binding forkhead associated (FHA) protein